jgi:hypothetical protein
MTEHRGLEAARYVTDTAILVGHDMTRVLANRATGTTIMTGVAALTHNFGAAMVDKGVSEIGGVVAHTTILVGLMNGRIRLRSGIERNEITIVT